LPTFHHTNNSGSIRLIPAKILACIIESFPSYSFAIRIFAIIKEIFRYHGGYRIRDLDLGSARVIGGSDYVAYFERNGQRTRISRTEYFD